ncbi:hypothetical protein DITRI_Ditri14bG0094700 [Diplodiscus trichospermus]
MATMVENSYEEARRQRLEENKKRFQELGISKISTCLAHLSNSHDKSQQRLSKPNTKRKSACTSELRRSSRARNPVLSYADDVDIDLTSFRKGSRSNSSSWASYLARPLDEVKTASYEERLKAANGAEDLQNSLQSGNPSFVKSMVRSHVYSCFWLGLPTKFCEDHLSKRVEDMVLEDENGSEYPAIYIGKRTGLSGGWRAFALDHKLDDGDALVFELIQPTRFKIYIIKGSSSSSGQGCREDVADKGLSECTKKKSRGSMKLNSIANRNTANLDEKNNGLPISKELQKKNDMDEEIKSFDMSQKHKKKGKATNVSELSKEELAKNGGMFASFKPRKKAATRLSRTRSGA